MSVWERVMACDAKWRAVYRNLAEAVVLYCACFIVASCVLPLFLHYVFSTLVGVLASVKRGGTTEYLLIQFTVL